MTLSVLLVFTSLHWIEILSFTSTFSTYNDHASGLKDQGIFTYLRTLTDAGNIQRFIDQFAEYERSRDEQDSSRDETSLSFDQVIRNDIDFSINPCDNFYQFACGGFINKTGSPSGSVSLFDSQNRYIFRQIKQEISQQIRHTDPLPLQKAKQMYKSCMDESSIESRGLSPLIKFLNDHGGWPVLGQWNKQNDDVIALLARTRHLQKDWETPFQPSGIIFGTTVQRDFQKKGQYTVYFDQPGLGQFSFSNLLNHEIYRLGIKNFYNKAYEDYLVDIAVILGANVETARRDMRDVLLFETKLANIMLFEEERRIMRKRYTKMTILEFSLRYPFIDWLLYFRQVLSMANIKIDLRTNIVLWAAPYFDKLGPILAETSKRTLVNYILFRGIQPLLPAANKAVQYVFLRYIATVNGIRQPRLPERGDYCTGIISNQMSWVTSRVFLERSSTNKTVRYVTMIKDYVRLVFIEMIKSSDWLTTRTRHFILEKMKSLTVDIGFPDEVYNNSFIDEFYRKFTFGKNFFENIKEALTENYNNVLSKLVRRPSNEWILRPIDINGLLPVGSANIEITFGILGTPMFNITYPPSMNFGGIGFLIGHEYGHGFDGTGMSFNGNGILGDYWSKQSYVNFLKKERCFIDQYSQYYLPDIKLFVANGGKTVNENICDFIGVKAAFFAYKKFKHRNMIEDKLPGLPFNGDQLFFINYARLWCTNTSPVLLRKYPYLDDHSMNRLRLIGPLQNSQEFARTFHCPLGSFMNPRKKCNFW